jgi:type IV pilus assembly protein PilW
VNRRGLGFSLVELMVAITLGTLLVGAVISVFVGSRSAYQSTAGVGALSNSGRFALNLIGETARSAGNFACDSGIPPTGSANTSVTLLAGNALGDTFTTAVTGFEANGTGNPVGVITLPAAPVVGAAGNWNPNIAPAVFTAAGPGPAPGPVPVQGTDVLVLRSSVAGVAPVYATTDVAIGATTIAVTSPAANALTAGQYAAISDCTKSVTFQIAGVAAGSPAAVDVAGGSLPLQFSTGALVAPLNTTVYYIGIGSDGDGALWRLEQVNGSAFTAEELVPDVEDMQVLYGIDTTGEGSATEYVTADLIGINSVLSLQVAVLAASSTGATPVPAAAITYNLLGNKITAPLDTRLRKVFYATISLRSAVD